MCWAAESVRVELPGMIEDSEVDAALLDEWDRLAERECTLEQQLQHIEHSVLENYPDINVAGIVVCAALNKDDRTLLRRYAALMRMKKRACQMIETVNREIASAQKEKRKELNEVNHMLADIESQIGKQAKKRRAAAIEWRIKRMKKE